MLQNASNNINIPAIIMVNLMGLIMLFALAIGSDLRNVRRTTTIKVLILMVISVGSCCILEPLAFMFDGTNRTLQYILNTLYCFVQSLWPIGWVIMVASYLNVKLSRLQKAALLGYFISMTLVLIINFFVPILFTIDSQASYIRADGYFFVIAAAMIVILDGAFLSYIARHRSNQIKFFPVWAFLIPAIIGRVIQTIWYGISAAVPFLAISIGCCALCMQNERFYRDGLTHLFNRAYLNALWYRLGKRASRAYTVIFVDVNDFKNINDNYGHVEGDKALICIADVLRKIVADKGEVIRYAGDEFFILYNSPNQQEVETLVKSINDTLKEVSVNSDNPYHLSVSAGFYSPDFLVETMDEVLDKVDKLMYEKKMEYYSNNEMHDRRSRK